MTGIRFGTDGWRAVMNDQFILANVKRVAWAIATYVREAAGDGAELIVAHDTRFFAEEFAEQCARICTRVGLSIRMAGRPLPTPLVAFGVRQYQTAGAIMLTASHNPARYNGIKFIPHYAGPATTDITEAIEDALARAPEDPPSSEGDLLVEELEPFEPYREHVTGLIDVEAIQAIRPKLLVDPMYGAGQGVLSGLLAGFGCKVHELHATRDVLFAGGMPDPSRNGLSEMARIVREDGFALGLGLDGDADRFGVIDDTGAYFGANDMLSMLAAHLVRDRGLTGSIVRTVATTHRLNDIGHALGCEVVETPVGFKYVAERMLDGGVLIGGEESGGLSIGGHIPEKDGVLANLLAVELFAHEKRPLSDVLADLEAEVGPRRFRRLDLEVPAARKAAVVEGLAAQPPSHVGSWAVREVRTIDGVKLVTEGDRWVLVRPSGTEPLLRVYLEAESDEGLATLAQFAEEHLT